MSIIIHILMTIYWYHHLATSNNVQKPYFHLGPFNLPTLKYYFLEYQMVIILFQSANLIYQSYEEEDSVGINFMCQRDWPMGCPDIRSNVILGVSASLFLDEFHI